MNTALILKLFFAVVGLIVLIALITMYVRSRNLSWSEFKRYMFRRQVFRVWVLLLTILYAGAFILVYQAHVSMSASAVVTLNYAEASRGLNANSTRYNMAEIICPEVLARAIHKGAFENVTVAQLQECLTVEPLIQGSSKDKDDYHIATEFVVHYRATDKTRHLNAENVVRLVADSYKEFYIDTYADNFDVLTMSADVDFSDMDYLDIVAYLQKEAEKVENYMYGLADRNSSYLADSGESFNSIAAKVYQYSQVQLNENLRSYILYNGVSKNVGDYVGRLSYDNMLLQYDYQRARGSFDVRNQAVAMYAEEMTRIVLVPTWDSEGEYYMGRTKVGIDGLSVEAEQYSQQAAACLKQIEDNDTTISLMKSAGTSGENENVNRLTSEMYRTIRSFASTAKAAGQGYSETRMNKCISSSVYGSSFVRSICICALATLAFYIALSMLVLARKLPKNEEEGMYVPEESPSQIPSDKEPVGSPR